MRMSQIQHYVDEINKLLTHDLMPSIKNDQRHHFDKLVQYVNDLKNHTETISTAEDTTQIKAQQLEQGTILESMSEGLLILNSSGAIESFNSAALKILGLSPKNILGKATSELNFKPIKEDGTPYSKEEYLSIIALKTGQKVPSTLIGIELSSGIKKWLMTSATPIVDQTSNNRSVQKVISTFSDVTDLVNARNENRFILDALKIGVWKYNPVTHELFCDNLMYQIFGINQSDFVSHNQALDHVLTPETKNRLAKEFKKALLGRKEFETTYEIIAKNGKKKFIGSKSKVARNKNGDPIMVYGINLDKTTEFEYQRDLELERAKSLHNAKLASLGEMAAGIAHEINNPLAIILGTIHLLTQFEEIPENFIPKLKTIQKATLRIEKIVKGLKKFSRTSKNGNHKIHNLKNLVSEVIVLTEAKTKRHFVPITIEIPENLKISCDEVEIEQVLINLINNAVDAIKEMKEKWIKLISFEEKNHVVLQVIDSGFDLPKEMESKLFQPFFTTKPVGEGTGLGLSIAKGILDQHKATITLNRTFKNTCFEIRFLKFD